MKDESSYLAGDGVLSRAEPFTVVSIAVFLAHVSCTVGAVLHGQKLALGADYSPD